MGCAKLLNDTEDNIKTNSESDPLVVSDGKGVMILLSASHCYRLKSGLYCYCIGYVLWPAHQYVLLNDVGKIMQNTPYVNAVRVVMYRCKNLKPTGIYVRLTQSIRPVFSSRLHSAFGLSFRKAYLEHSACHFVRPI